MLSTNSLPATRQVRAALIGLTEMGTEQVEARKAQNDKAGKRRNVGNEDKVPDRKERGNEKARLPKLVGRETEMGFLLRRCNS
ncbi:uncharacterized protein SPSK_05751 [Sporothrix schenckii 1099-18]|uniref:Uncharacterized protein n=1 Tax=Sporothrix schenckii 1099-18 TaxID=1397361 RepID=A0A0F2LVF7_SPOSC|nr:uncharacterized protein SPSK_05751 [Sporothrix schenckii 1099-18]KJR80839.1 hypothetical protein SPSK_05751 [Sporothrix schenckii 1099-18]